MIRARGLLLGGASFVMLVGADGGAVSPVPVSAAPLDVSAVVSKVVPAAGVAAGGTSIDIQGTGFTDASDVVIGGTVVTAACPSAGGCFTFNSDTDITAITPPGTAGTSDVTVDNPSFPGTPNPPSDNFTYQQAPPAVTSVSADSGPDAGGAPAITVGGSSFSGSGFTTTGVSFDGTAASFSITNSSTISATPPAGTGLVDITVTTSSGDGTSVETSATSAADTYVYAPVPSVSNVVPGTGPTGGQNPVVLTGTGFESNNAPSASYSASDVFVDTTDITTSPCPGTPTSPCFTVTSPTRISVGYMPPHAAAPVDITVQTIGGLSATSSGDQYTYQQLPAVTGVSPTAGPLGGGNNINVSGSDFTSATDVFVGVSDISTTPCAATFPCFNVNGSTSITVEQLPPHSAGTVDITVQTPGGTSAITSADQYTYVPPAPTVTGVAPSTGPASGAKSVTLTGTGFQGSGYVASDVFVGTIDISTQCPGATCFTINSSTSITIPSMPPHAVGTVDITVETSGGISATSPADQYTYEPSPVVTSVVPPAGVLVGGNTVTVHGSGFSGATDVTVGPADISATPCPGTPTSPCFNLTSATQITVEDFPAHGAATVDITVTTPFGVSQTSSADTYAYAPVPTVTSLSPHASAPAGGISVNVTGSGFASSSNFTTTTVLVGTVAITTSPCVVNPSAQCYTVNSPTSITIGYMPAEPAGQVNITVGTPGGTSAATSQNVFSYDDSLPDVSELLPKNGATAGGEAVSMFSVSGGFGQAGQDYVNDVLFGTVDVPSSNSYPCPNSSTGCFIVVGPTQMAVYTPAHAAGIVDVRVETPAGESGTGTRDLYTFVPPGAYTAITPYRACDTRPPGHGIVQNQCDIGTNHTLGPNGVVAAQITQPGGPVPPGAQAVVVNVTAIDHSSTITLVTAYPAGTARPVASNINLAGDTVESNLVIVQLSQAGGTVPAGAISLFNALGSADVIVDVEGYFSSPSGGGHAGEFHSIPPLRICDSRAGMGTICAGAISRPLLAGQWRDVVLSGGPAGTPQIPSTLGTADAAVFNLTGTNGTQATLLAVAPALANHLCPTKAPAFSNLNPAAGIALPNRVISKLGPNQDVCLFSPVGSINFITDVNGWFGSSTAPAGVLFYSVPPTRVCDTRPQFGFTCSGVLTPRLTKPILIAGSTAVPADNLHSVQPVAVVANLTGIAGTANTVFILYPSDKAAPRSSDLNPSAGQVIANLAVVGLSTTTSDGDISLYNAAGDINAVLDVAGWFQ